MMKKIKALTGFLLFSGCVNEASLVPEVVSTSEKVASQEFDNAAAGNPVVAKDKQDPNMPPENANTKYNELSDFEKYVIEEKGTERAFAGEYTDTEAAGFAATKMKVGLGAKDDVRLAEAVRASIGEDYPFMVDANMKYTVDSAVRAARAFQPFDLTWFEEPIPPDDPKGHERILRDGGIPIASGENLRTLWDFRTAIEGGVTFPEPDVTNCGGVTPFMKSGLPL